MENLEETFVLISNLIISFDEVKKLSDYERKFYVKIIKKLKNE